MNRTRPVALALLWLAGAARLPALGDLTQAKACRVRDQRPNCAAERAVGARFDLRSICRSSGADGPAKLT